MSGAGKSHAIRALEDLGYYCVDNLPTALIPVLADLSRHEDADKPKVAVVVDVREGGFIREFPPIWRRLLSTKELDPILIDNSYYVATDPKKGNEKAYALLVKILNDNNLVAIGKVILKDRENVVALRPYQRGLVMHVLNYLDDMKPVDEIPEMGNTKSKLDPQEISLGEILVQKYRSKEFDIGDYSDTYVQELRKLIEAKSKGKKFVSSAPKETKPTKDLLEALKASIETKKK